MSFHPDSKLEDGKIKLSDVIQFQLIQTNLKEKKFQLHFQTRDHFKIYADSLKFTFIPENSLPYELKFHAKIKSEKIFDKFYQEDKWVFDKDNEFDLFPIPNFSLDQAKIEIYIQACSHQVCLLPSILVLNLNPNAVSSLKEKKLALITPFHAAGMSSNSNLNGIKQNENKQIQLEQTKEKTSNIDILNQSLSYFLFNAFKNGSLFLFPALFLAGLLMNLTPCVYPMIPITLSVMSQFENTDGGEENKKRRRIIFPLIYVGAMVVVYSLLGVFAGMTGNIFGSQFSSPLFSIVMALFMFLFGFAMLGIFNLAKIQSFAVKIPLAKNNPALAVATMGAVSGLVSAPCTGPILSMILVLIAQNKDPFSGFLYMMFFALGFGTPYVILGFYSQKIMKMPKFPRGVEFVKLSFAALMFSLGIYFLKSLLQKVVIFQFLFLKPFPFLVIAFCLLALIFLVLADRKKIMGRICHIGAFICLFFLCLWLTLSVTNSFREVTDPNSMVFQKNLMSSPIHWLTNLDAAVKFANKSGKPILVDVWADWCVACLEMEKTTWKDQEIIDVVNEKYIPVKLDFSNSSESLEKQMDDWKIMGLPATIFFKAPVEDLSHPSRVFQGVVSKKEFIDSLHMNK